MRKDDNCDVSFGLGFAPVAGFRTDYPSSATNPILFPQGSGGLGRTSASAEFFQMTPAAAYNLTPKTSIGFSPILTIGKLDATPFIFASPNANGQYPTGNDPNYIYGGGFQVGVYHEGESGINLGASWKSPQWMESGTVNLTDENGLERRESFNLDLPMMASVGASYTGIEQWLFAVDVRYLDYENTDGFDKRGYGDDYAVQGLGWDSIFSTAAGVQYKPIESLALRLGYSYSENPISGSEAMFNVASPLINQHLLGVGLSYEVVADTLFSLTYLHGFENSVEGPIENPQGPVPGTSVENTMSANAIAMALTFRY